MRISRWSLTPVYIPYEAADFPPNSITGGNGRNSLPVTWGDILRAAITVGRPGRYCALRLRVGYPKRSLYEILFRWSLVMMSLENARFTSRLQRTNTARNLDPTEKGMVNYFLGMSFCKLFAEKLLRVPWLLHLDVFRPELNVELSGRSRPDLIGQNDRQSCWHSFECKGRVSRPDNATKQKAKGQALRVQGVNGQPCTLHVGAITYYVDEEPNFYWRDPPAEGDEGSINLSLPDDVWRHYYGLVSELLQPPDEVDSSQRGEREPDESEHLTVSIEEADAQIVVHRAVAGHLSAGRWEQARLAALESSEALAGDNFAPDGLRVDTGESWHEGR